MDVADWRTIDVGKFQQRWPNFEPEEFASPDTFHLLLSEELLDKLQALRSFVGKPLYINSGFRSLAHNIEVGGEKGSYHLKGMAADVSMIGHDKKFIYSHARLLGFGGIGFYPGQYHVFMHLDVGPFRWWGDPIPWGIDPNAPVLEGDSDVHNGR